LTFRKKRTMSGGWRERSKSQLSATFLSLCGIPRNSPLTTPFLPSSASSKAEWPQLKTSSKPTLINTTKPKHNSTSLSKKSKNSLMQGQLQRKGSKWSHSRTSGQGQEFPLYQICDYCCLCSPSCLHRPLLQKLLESLKLRNTWLCQEAKRARKRRAEPLVRER